MFNIPGRTVRKIECAILTAQRSGSVEVNDELFIGNTGCQDTDHTRNIEYAILTLYEKRSYCLMLLANINSMKFTVPLVTQFALIFMSNVGDR